MKRIFLPVLFILNRLQYSKKLLVVFFFLITPLLGCLNCIHSDIQKEIGDKVREKRIISYITYTVKLTKDIQENQAMVCSYLRDNANFQKEKIEEQKKTIESDIKQIDKINANLSDKDLSQRWGKIKGQWKDIKATAFNLQPRESMQMFTTLIDEISSLERYILSRDDLIKHLTPQDDTVFHLLVDYFPASIVKFGQAREMGTDLLGRKSMGDNDRLWLTTLKSELQDLNKSIANNIERGVKNYPELKKEVTTYTQVMEKKKKFITALDNYIIRSKQLTAKPQFFFSIGKEAIDSEYAFYNTLAQYMNSSIEKEIHKLQDKSLSIFLLSIFIVASIIYIFAGFYLSMKQSITKLVEASLLVEQGNFDVKLERDTKDEFSIIEQCFNQILLTFKGILQSLKKTNEKLIEAEGKYRHLVEDAPMGVYVCQGDFIVYANPYMVEILGYSEEEIKKVKFLDLVYKDDLPTVLERLSLLQKGKEVKAVHSFRVNRKDGEVVELEIRVANTIYNGGPAITGTVLDITKRNRVAFELEKSQQHYQALFQGNFDGIYALNTQGMFINANPAAEKMTGYTEGELCKMSFVSLLLPEDRERVIQIFNEVAEGISHSFEVRIMNKNGQIQDLNITANPIIVHGQTIGVIGIAKNVTDLKETEAKINRLAYYDDLTGLPNKRYFNQYTEELIAKGKDSNMFALLLLDLDRFKVVNNSLGRLFGDRVLKAVALRLCAELEEKAIICRGEGDSFIFILPNIKDKNETIELAEKILHLFNQSFEFDDYELYVTPSIGISLYPDNGHDVEELIKCADYALYKAKERQNTYQFCSSDIIQARGQLALETDLRKAIANQEIMVYYQPQVDVKTGEIIGAEALVRWHHPEKGWISPAEFIPVAEQAGLITPIGNYVLRSACKQNKIWQEKGLAPITIAVNFSAAQFLQKDIIQTVKETIRDTGLDPQYLDIEITESIAVDIEHVLEEFFSCQYYRSYY